MMAFIGYNKSKLHDEMYDWYVKRTNRHISLVQKYCKIIANNDLKFLPLLERMRVHDKSKFESPERDAYVYITWKYHCAQTGKSFNDCNPPNNIDELMNIASHHHVTTNSHHAEYHSPRKTELLNRENRDEPPEKIVDATSMPDLDIAEMVADWSAMSEELNQGSCRGWANKNVNVRWKFTDKQVKLIYRLIDLVEKHHEKI